MKKRTKLRKKDGFTLIITIMLLAMLTLLAVGMLTLGAITLRSGSVAENKRTANANARMALMLAIGELQKTLGNDNRVTANASLLRPNSGTTGTPQSGDRMMGVWKASNPYANHLVAAGSQTVPSYDQTTNANTFEGWLVSAPKPADVKEIAYGTGSSASSGTVLFSEKMDGFEVKAQSVDVTDAESNPNGSYAWSVVQEADKAKINVGGDMDRTVANDNVHAPTRPNLEIGTAGGGGTGGMKQPEKDWVERNNKVVSMSQASLDTAYGLAKGGTVSLGPDYTASANGVLADVANNRLKTDLSLAFEMSDSDFQKTSWGDLKNPFMLGNSTVKETSLFAPTTGATGVPYSMQIEYGAASYNETFMQGSPPTFGTLRSYYQMYQHLYNSTGGPSAFVRPQASTYWTSYQKPVRGVTETGVGPVVDRLIYMFSMWISPTGQASVVMTPVITLWNPYNVGIDSTGYVAYPYIDVPFGINFTKSDARGVTTQTYGKYLSQLAGLRAVPGSPGDGRQRDPYFYCQMTADGTDNTTKPIHLDAGEVRIFVCSDKTPIVFERAKTGVEKSRIVHMKPVESGTDLDLRGGIAYPVNQDYDDGRASMPVGSTDYLAMTVSFDVGTFDYGVCLEDDTRIKNGYKTRLDTSAHIFSEIRVIKASKSGTQNDTISIPRTIGSELIKKIKLGGAIDTYHRTASQRKNEKTPPADIVYTSNMRQRFINPSIGPTTNFVANGNGVSPHYEAHLINGATFDSIGLQANGNDSYYGESNAPSTGRTHLAFFDLPREPMLSLGGFQHADMADMVTSSAYQFGNSWASPYVDRGQVAKFYRKSYANVAYSGSVGMYDTSYLANSALWDSYYFSSLAPKQISRKTNGTPTDAVYNNPQTTATLTLDKVIDAWLKDSQVNPLRNPRYTLYRGSSTDSEIKTALMDPKGCRDISAHLLVDGPFNVNSTSKIAWKAMLASLRGESFNYEGFAGNGTSKDDKSTGFPRLRYPVGPGMQSGGDRWTTFRQLSDSDIDTLAEKIVDEVKARGPFLSLGEFVNRRLVTGSDDKGYFGAIQAAINNTSLNQMAKINTFDVSPWLAYKANIKINDIGFGLPFWLTQADILSELGPFLTVRSDTFTVRAYGEARDKDNKVLARSWCEATVQRVPDFLDSKDAATLDASERQSDVNKAFGRRFDIVAFRWISPDEINPTTTT